MIDLQHCRFHIDEPKPLFARRGGMRLAGWCFDERSSSPVQVRLAVGGRVYPCESGMPRADVAVAFPQFSQAARSGFQLESWLPLGHNSGHIEISADGTNWVRAKAVIICAEAAPSSVWSNRRRVRSAREIRSRSRDGPVHVQEPIEQLWAAGRRSLRDLPARRSPRRCAAHVPQVPWSEHSGFSCRVHLPTQKAPVQLKVRLRSGLIVVTPLPKMLAARDQRAIALLQALDETPRVVDFVAAA
jgi:hypothetical protein